MPWPTTCRTSRYVSLADPRLACPEPDRPVRSARPRLVVARRSRSWQGAAGRAAGALAPLPATGSRRKPCGHCHSCQLLDKGNHPDLGTIARDSKTIGVEAIREICTRLQGSAQLGRGKVVIIPDAERMTESAANALLKTLEEPAGDSLLLLIASRFPGCFPPFSVAVTSMSVSCLRRGRRYAGWPSRVIRPP